MQKAFCEEGGTERMKKITKMILIIVVVLTVVGFGFIIAGTVTAGGVGALTAQLRSGELNFGNWHFEDGVYYKGDVEVDLTDVVDETMGLIPSGNEEDEKNFTEDIKTVEVDADLANVTIKTTDVVHIKVTLKEGYKKYYKAETNGDVLHISYDVQGHSFKQGPKILIEIPEEMVLDGIYIDTDLGEVTLSKLAYPLQELEINSDLGNIRVEDCTVQESATIAAALGNIVIEDSHFRKIDMSADMGNIELSGTIEDEITAQADMGNIEVDVDGKAENYNIQLSSDMGNVEFEGHKHGNSFESCHEAVNAYIVLNCDMGNVELKFD